MSQQQNLENKLLKKEKNNHIKKLIRLYTKQGKKKIAHHEIDAGCYYLTNAYIFALECGSRKAKKLHKLLKFYGREE